jgi:hypothetical protein
VRSDKPASVHGFDCRFRTQDPSVAAMDRAAARTWRRLPQDDASGAVRVQQHPSEGGADGSVPSRMHGADRRIFHPVLDDRFPRALLTPRREAAVRHGLLFTDRDQVDHVPRRISATLTRYVPLRKNADPVPSPAAASVPRISGLLPIAIRSASGRIGNDPALPTSPRGFWGRCELRRAEGAFARTPHRSAGPSARPSRDPPRIIMIA